ncbi:hypothetical protein ACFW04_011310 [Cataglyphis niger]
MKFLFSNQSSQTQNETLHYLCPKPNVTDNPLSRKSHVEEFSDPIPALFQALTGRGGSARTMAYLHIPESADGKLSPLKPNIMTVNCTKCQASCQSMGSTSYRWFHDGCCECVGNTCINYGIKESRCTQCPLEKEGETDEYNDYGQDEEGLGEDEMD